MATSKLQIIIEALTGDANKDLDATEKKLNDLKTTTGNTATEAGKSSKAMAALKTALAGAAVAAAGFVATKVVEFIRDSVGAAEEAAKIHAQLEAVIKSTGGAAGITADEVEDMAKELSDTTGVEDDLIIKNGALLLTFKEIGEDIFPETMQAAIDMSAVMGTDLQGSIVMVGKALNDPIEGMSALQRVGVTFNETQEATIKALVESGDVMGAQKIVLEELQSEFGGAASAIHDAGTNSDTLKNSLGNLKEEIGADLLPTVRDVNTAVATYIDKLTLNRQYIDEVKAAEEAGILTKAEATEKLRELHQGTLDVSDEMQILQDKLYGANDATMIIAGSIGGTDGFTTILEDNADTITNVEIVALEDLEAALGDADTMMKSYNDKLIYNTIAANLNEEQQYELAEAMGLIDPKTELAYEGMAELTEIYDLNEDGVIDAKEATDDYLASIAELKATIDAMEDKTVYVDIYEIYHKAGGEQAEESPTGYQEKATGGPVVGYQPYIVGEQGPELFIPDTSGTIIPNNVINNFSINMASTGAAGRDVVSAVRLLELLYG